MFNELRWTFGLTSSIFCFYDDDDDDKWMNVWMNDKILSESKRNGRVSFLYKYEMVLKSLIKKLASKKKLSPKKMKKKKIERKWRRGKNYSRKKAPMHNTVHMCIYRFLKQRGLRKSQ